MKRLRAIAPLAALLAAAGGLVLLARPTEVAQTVEFKTLDWRFRHLSRPERHDKDIVLVAIDQPSLDHFKNEGLTWPWPRSVYGALLNFLKKGGARAVVFDMLFTDPSPFGQAEDAAFGKSLRNFGNTVLAMKTGDSPDPHRAKSPPVKFSVPADAAVAFGPAKQSAEFPIPEILAGSRRLGDTTARADIDGIYRRVPLVSEMDGRLYPTLPAAAALAATGKTLAELAPRLTGGGMLVRFHGKSLTDDPRFKTYGHYSAGDLILSWQALEEKRAPSLDPALFKDKVVFVSMSATGLFDNHPSPVSPSFPGTEIVAAATDNLIHGDYLLPAGTAALLLLILAALAASGIASLQRRTWAALLIMAAASAALATAAGLAFTRGVWLDMTAPQLALWLGFAAASAYNYAVEGRQKRYIQGAFSHYLSPEIVRQISENPGKLALGGERREVTFYFSDIQGFTSFSEKLDPETLTKLMNEYLSEMTETILDSGGTLDKYIGDAIMAFWGAPIDNPDHALTACKVALANQKKLESLRETFAARGYPPVRNRIGLNSGPASIGNMGSSKRFSYTAIGDNVNLASRLEGANKAYGSYILISESTLQGAGNAVETRELDFVKVKGKNLPIRVYELLGLKGETDERLLKKARLFESGLAPFRARKFDEAIAVFESVIKEFGDDHASDEYLERCRHYKSEPPPPDWDGSHALTEK